MGVWGAQGFAGVYIGGSWGLLSSRFTIVSLGAYSARVRSSGGVGLRGFGASAYGSLGLWCVLTAFEPHKVWLRGPDSPSTAK